MQKGRIKEYLLHSPDATSMIMLLGLYVILFAVFGFSSSTFFKFSNLSNIFKNSAELGILAAGMSMVVITGKIDLSLSSTYCFSGIILALLLINGISLIGAIAITLLCAIAFGVVNGIFIGYMNLQDVLVTIATQTLIRGLCYIFAGSKTIMIRGIAPGFGAFGSIKVFDLFTIAFLVMVALLFIQYFVLKRTRFGIMLLSIGNNPNTTRLSGYNVKRSIALVYVLNSIIGWLAGVLMIARLQGVESTYGSGYEFTALTIVLMGGIAFGGGKGNSIGLFLSAIVMAMALNGMNLMGISALYQSAFVGVMILLMIARPNVREIRATAAAKREIAHLNQSYKNDLIRPNSASLPPGDREI